MRMVANNRRTNQYCCWMGPSHGSRHGLGCASLWRQLKLRDLDVLLRSRSRPADIWTKLARRHMSALGHKQTKLRPRSYFGLRGNGMNPSRFGILTLGSDCASSTSFDPTIPLRLRI
jgi:hypothetical protein